MEKSTLQTESQSNGVFVQHLYLMKRLQEYRFFKWGESLKQLLKKITAVSPILFSIHENFMKFCVLLVYNLLSK